jgi:Tfp pilus assembly protein PilN
MLTWKTAIGIAVHGDDLECVCLKRGLNGISEGGRMTLTAFRTRRPEEAGAAYREFLRSQGLSAANAVVALPRRDVLLRTIALPAEALRTLDKAIEYQVDSLHPFEEGGVDYAYSVLTRGDNAASPDASRLNVAVVMIEKGIAAGYYEWFSQAGIPVSGFTTSAAVLCGLAMESAPAFVISRHGESAEILAVSKAALLSREAPVASLNRELQLCRAELRLPDDADVHTIEQPDVAYAAALSALVTRPFSVNLLAENRRVYESPWTHALTYALSGAVILLLFAVGMRGALQDYLYLQRVNAEIRSLETRVKYIQKLEGKEGRQLTRLTTLAALRGRTAGRIRTLAELTRLLPATASLADASIGDDGVTITGSADSASGLLALLGASPQFRNPEFTSAITKTAEGKEQFRIRMQLTGGQP